MKKIIKQVCTFSLLSISFVIANQAIASGIRVGLESAADLGNQFAGGAALAGDASTNYYNAAGITRIHNDQLVASFVGVSTYNQFAGTTFAASTTTPGFPGANFTGSGRASTRDVNVVPTFHYSMPIYDRTYLGVSIFTPYGLADDYGSTSILRYSTVHASAYSTDLGPSIAYKFTDAFSGAIGPDLMRFHFDAQSQVRTQLASGLADSYSDNNAYGWGWGGHAGLLYEFNQCSRIGLSYRTQIVQHLNGTSKFVGAAPVPSATNNNLQVNLTLPPMTMLSGYYAFTPKWAVLGTVDYTQWSAFHTISATNIAAPAPVLAVNYSAIQNYRDTVHGAVAVNYQMNDAYLFRFGVGVDQNSNRAQFTSPTNPGQGFYAVNIGLRWAASKAMSVDGAYSHAFLRTVSTNHATTIPPTQSVSETGNIRGHGDVLGIQFNWNLT